MDIVLEFTDTFIADYAYAYLFPSRPAPYDFPNATNVNQTFSSWTYRPATKFIQIQPSQAAYTTSLPRDNLYRQLATLFFITWSVVTKYPFPSAPGANLLPTQDLRRDRLLHLR